MAEKETPPSTPGRPLTAAGSGATDSWLVVPTNALSSATLDLVLLVLKQCSSLAIAVSRYLLQGDAPLQLGLVVRSVEPDLVVENTSA